MCLEVRRATLEVWGSGENAQEPLLSSYIHVDPGDSVQAASLTQGSLPLEPSHQPFLGFFEKSTYAIQASLKLI